MQTAKTQVLVLDGQGVIFDAPFREFLLMFADANQVHRAQVTRRWHDRLRDLAWRGLIDDEMLWNELAGKPVDVDETARALDANYKLGPAAKHLANWSRTARIWLLSNHRSAWLLPKLAGFGLRGVFERLLISDVTGFVKPEPEAFGQLLGHGVSAEEMLFVDDQLHNVEAARMLGCRAILATSDERWLDQVDASLSADASA